MTVRTTRVDLSAIIRSTPILKSRSGGGGGSFGIGLAPAITGFEFVLDSALIDGEESYAIVAVFKVDQADAIYTLADDAGERFSIEVDNDGEIVVDEGGYSRIVSNGFEPALGDGEYTIVIRVSWGGSYQDFTRTIPVQAGEPHFYTYTYSPSQFDSNAVDGQGVADLFPDDTRIAVTAINLIDDAGGRFRVVNNVNIVRTAVAITDGPYTLTADITFSDGHVEPDSSFTLTAFSIG